MKVYLDIVVNHTADVILLSGGTSYRTEETPYRDCKGKPYSAQRYAGGKRFRVSPRYQPRQAIVLPEKRTAKRPAWLNDVTRYHNRGDIDSRRARRAASSRRLLRARRRLHRAAVRGRRPRVWGDWIRSSKIDGFRVDTAKHVDRAFFKAWMPKIRAAARAAGVPAFEVFGEVFETDAATLASFVRERGVPNVIDFPLQDALMRYAGAPPARVGSRRGWATTTTRLGNGVAPTPSPFSATTTSAGRRSRSRQGGGEGAGSSRATSSATASSTSCAVRRPCTTATRSAWSAGRRQSGTSGSLPTGVTEWQNEERVGSARSAAARRSTSSRTRSHSISARSEASGMRTPLSTGASFVRVARAGRSS